MYVAVKGGEQAIDQAHEFLAEKRRGDTSIKELSVEQIEQQLPLAVDRVMTEGSLYDRELAALAPNAQFIEHWKEPEHQQQAALHAGEPQQQPGGLSGRSCAERDIEVVEFLPSGEVVTEGPHSP